MGGGEWGWGCGGGSEGGWLHAPQEITGMLSDSLERALQARVLIAQIVAQHGHTGPIPLPDVSTKGKAQAYIGLGMKTLRQQKARFNEQILPQWIKTAQQNQRLVTAR